MPNMVTVDCIERFLNKFGSIGSEKRIKMLIHFYGNEFIKSLIDVKLQLSPDCEEVKVKFEPVFDDSDIVDVQSTQSFNVKNLNSMLNWFQETLHKISPDAFVTTDRIPGVTHVTLSNHENIHHLLARLKAAGALNDDTEITIFTSNKSEIDEETKRLNMMRDLAVIMLNARVDLKLNQHTKNEIEERIRIADAILMGRSSRFSHPYNPVMSSNAPSLLVGWNSHVQQELQIFLGTMKQKSIRMLHKNKQIEKHKSANIEGLASVFKDVMIDSVSELPIDPHVENIGPRLSLHFPLRNECREIEAKLIDSTVDSLLMLQDSHSEDGDNNFF